MKYFSKISALILSTIFVINTGLSAHAMDSDSEFIGYTFNDSVGAVIFDSWTDYQMYSVDAREVMKNDTNDCYMKNYDYICVPKELEDKTDSISCISITPRYCCITFTIGNEETDFYYYYPDDRKESSYYYSGFAVKFGTKSVIGNTDAYKYNNKYYYVYNDCFFSVDSDYNFDKSTDERVTRIYTDPHFIEQNGKLYFINDDNQKESGWKTINGHKYYFRSSDKTAVCGKKAKVNGIVYSFNANGICKGKFTGYTRDKNGNRIQYKNGIAVVN